MARHSPRRRAEKQRGGSSRGETPDAPGAPAVPAGPVVPAAATVVGAPAPASAEPVVQPPADAEPQGRLAARGWAGAWVLLTLVGAAGLAAGILQQGPGWVPQVGAVVVASCYVWALAARTGGRPVVFGVLTAAVGAVTLVSDLTLLRNGAAVMTCAVGAILAVVATVPAVRTRVAVREVVVAVVLAALGGLAAAGLQPTIVVARFEYLTLGMALVGCLVVVHRLGAGFHGLGRRGLFIVLFGGVVLGLTLAYGELLRRYGTPALVEVVQDGVRWLRDTAGASPRPIVAVLGVPALVWGVHMRARRRQGWWVCAFGVVATVAVAQALLQTAVPLQEAALSLGYGVLVGLLLGYVLIRLDLALTGGSTSRGRRGRRDEQAAALRPEPPRIDALL